MTDAHGVAREQLRSFISRIERLEEEKKTIADDIRDVKAEAKAMGFSVKAINEIIKLRKKDANERAEEEIILDTYKMALGMIPEPFEPEEEPETNPPASDDSPIVPTSLAESEAEEISASNSPETADENEAVATEATVLPSAERITPHRSGSAAANAGGDHVDAEPATMAGSLVQPLPAKHPILLLRPHCQHPGEEICGGSGRNHCRACAVATREEEVA